jgi:hypothetical protein
MSKARRVCLSGRFRLAEDGHRMPTAAQLQRLFRHKQLPRLLWDMTESSMLSGVYLEHGTMQKDVWTIQPLALDFSKCRCANVRVTPRKLVAVDFVVPLIPNDLLGSSTKDYGGTAALKPSMKARPLTAERVSLAKLRKIVTDGLFHSMYAGGFSTKLGLKAELLPTAKRTWTLKYA